MTPPVQLILDEPPHSGAWNMAVDAALLEESLRTRAVFVRLYRWAEPTISSDIFRNRKNANLPRYSGTYQVSDDFPVAEQSCTTKSKPTRA